MFNADMARLPVEHQSDVALKWRERCINMMRETMNPLADGLGIAAAGLYTGAIGWWDGYNEAARDKLIVQWQTVTAPNLGVSAETHPEPFQDVVGPDGQVLHKAVSDPRGFLYLNKTAYPTIAFALMGAVGLGGPTYNRYLMAPAIGGVGYLIGSKFRDLAYKASVKKDAGQLASAANGGAAGLPGGNGAPTNGGNGNGNGNGAEADNPYWGGFPRVA
jgi:hypothetical protein